MASPIFSFTFNGQPFFPPPTTANPYTYNAATSGNWVYYILTQYVYNQSSAGNLEVSYTTTNTQYPLYLMFVAQGGSSGSFGNIIIDDSVDKKNFRCTPATPGGGGSGDVNYQNINGNANINFTMNNIGTGKNCQITINNGTPIIVRCGLNGSSGTDLTITNSIPSGGAGGNGGTGGGAGGDGGSGAYANYIGPFNAAVPNPYNGGNGIVGQGYSGGEPDATLDGLPTSSLNTTNLPVTFYDGTGTAYIYPQNIAQVLLYYQVPPIS